MKTEICIIGAGPSGLISAIFSAMKGTEVVLLETNTNAGCKLLITGGGRCNITHKIKPGEFVKLLGKQGRFLSYCIYEYSPEYIMSFFADLGLKTIIENDGCVFPLSQKAHDVRNVLVEKAKVLDVKFLYDKRAESISKESDCFVIETKGKQIIAEKVILATGGISWPKTGSKGDGYRFAENFGHNIIEPRASLVPLVVEEQWLKQLGGVAITNVKITAKLNNKKITTQGALVFTDNGIGGPAAQDMSRYLTDMLPAKEQPIPVAIDLILDLEQHDFEKEIIDRCNENPKKQISNLLADFLPRRLSSIICKLNKCDEELTIGHLSKETRRKIVELIKNMPLSVLKTRSIEEAVVTRGGVDLDEIDSKTMESKICKGLFFAGEVINADAPCGGYNLQIAWSTGALAGTCAAKK